MKKFNPTFLKKLSSYSGLAGSIIALPSLAQGQVIYTDVVTDFVGHPYAEYGLDLNNDGTDDFLINVNEHFWAPFFQQAYIRIYPSPGNAIAIGDYGPGVFGIYSEVGAGLIWNEDQFQKLGAASLSYYAGNSNFFYNGSWLNVDGEFLALRFKINNIDHYGWVRLSTDVFAVFNPELIVHDYAYAAAPETSIKAGCVNGNTFFADADGDSYGDPATNVTDCVVPSGYVENDMDCNDANAAVYPGATEIINGIDDDCNGIVDDVNCITPTNLEIKNISSTSVKLKWAPEVVAAKYSLRYKAASSASWIQLNPQGKSKIVEGLLPNTKYVWQIKSVCGDNPKITSAWSPKQFFTTLPLKITNENMSATSLEIYPNPSAGNTTLHFNLTQSSQVSIKIFDVNGKEVSKVLYSTYETGDHSVQINTASYAKGIYLVQMISGDGIQKQKLIVQ
ncbi:MAG: T9SS type A sorting domain-containing protein [Chitinophagaceae bacterium]|nr:T9SS type A sorting domain-containing protein [Chitinophagaceae bacterium]